MTGDRRHSTTRTLLTGVLVVLLLGGGVAGASGWFNEVHVRAGVSSGTWSPSPTPTPTPEPSDGSGGQSGGTPTPDPSGGTDTPAGRVITPGNADTVISATTWTQRDGGPLTSGTSADNPGRGLCAVVDVHGVPGATLPWQLDIDLAGAPFNGENPGIAYRDGQSVRTLDATHLRVEGTVALGGATHRSVTLCTDGWLHSQVPVLAGASTATTTAPTWSGGTAGSGDVCVTTTVTGQVDDLADNPFYYGWSHSLDLGAAVQEYSRQRTTQPRHVVFTPGPASGYNYRIDGAGSDWMDFRPGYQLSSSTLSALRGTGQVAVKACLTAN